VKGMAPVKGLTAGGSRITFYGQHLDAFAPLGAYFIPPESTGLPALYGFADGRLDSWRFFMYYSKSQKQQYVQYLVYATTQSYTALCSSFLVTCFKLLEARR